MLQKVIFSSVRAIFFVFEYPVSPAENNFNNSSEPYSGYSRISETLYVFCFFLLNVELDEFGPRKRKASPFANPVFTPLSA